MASEVDPSSEEEELVAMKARSHVSIWLSVDSSGWITYRRISSEIVPDGMIHEESLGTSDSAELALGFVDIDLHDV
jgi:hypothetical protein